MRQYSCDVAVLGGGGAGLMAAMRSAEAGLGKIAVFEKGGYFGGSIIMAGTFFTSDSPDSENIDSEENAYILYKEYLRALEYTGNKKLQKKYIFNARYMARWLQEKGLQAVYGHRGPDKFMLMAESPEEHAGGKRLGALVASLLENGCRQSGVDMFLHAQAKRIITDESGTASGVLVEMDGEEVMVSASAVIIACGGVTGDYDKMCKYFPDLFAPGEDVTSKAAKTNSGDGIEMAGELGAETGKHMGVHLLSPTFNHGQLIVSAVIQNPSCLWLNANGKRITDESRSKQSQAVISQSPGRCIFALADAGIKKDVDELVSHMPPRLTGLNPDLDGAMKTAQEKFGNVLISDSLSEVAEFIGCGLHELLKTIEEYNTYCRNGFDEEMLKDKKFLKPVTTSPYYVVRAGRYCDCSQGGITVDDNLRVMKPDGTFIPGLYAIGDNAGGFVTEYYFQGAGMTFALTSGFMIPDFLQEYLSEM